MPKVGPLTVFVYFKVPADVGESQVRTALARLAEAVATDGRATLSVMRRHRERAGAASAAVAPTTVGAAPATASAAQAASPVTWMEVHEGIARDALDDWLGWLERAAAETGVAALAPAGRHAEVFEPVVVDASRGTQ